MDIQKQKVEQHIQTDMTILTYIYNIYPLQRMTNISMAYGGDETISMDTMSARPYYTAAR